MKIIDCFIFYNELDMLKYRIELLSSIVDYFIIVESKYTFSGIEKELYYNNNKELFDNHKVIHIIEDNAPHIFPNINIEKNEQWINEYYHRNCIKKGIEQLKLKEEDIIIISDLDEIPDPETLKKIKNNEIDVSINCLEQDMYYYNLNSKLMNKWYHSKIMRFKDLNEQNLTISQIRIGFYSIIFNGGWHLSYFGDKYYIQNKIKNFAHQEYNNPEYNELDKIQEKINESKDIFNRKDNPIQRISINNNNYLPPEYKKYLYKFIDEAESQK